MKINIIPSPAKTPYYDRNGITIYMGDCLEVMPRLSPPFDAIISDWPYGTTACAWDSVIPLEPLWAKCKRLVKQTGAAVLFGSQPFTTDLIASNRKWFRYEIIWQKDQPTGGLNANRMPLRNHENILVFYRSLPTYNPQKFNYQSARFKIGEKSQITRSRYNPNIDIYGEIGANGRYDWIEDGKRYPLSVVFCSSKVRGTDSGRMVKALHPTQKPVSLMQYLIRTYTNPGDLTLDNCMGSGTTLVASQNEGRRCVGIELSEEYCRIAVDRLRQPSFFSLPSQPNGAAPKQLQLIEVKMSV